MAESNSEVEEELGVSENDEIEGDIDRISTLPDSVLCHILSFLPTKTSVITSLLSRRWRHLWENLQVLNLSDDSHVFYHQFELFKRFAVFVNAVLALRRARHIRKFTLSCGHSQIDPFYAHSIDTWLRVAIGPYLEELTLTLFSTDGHGFFMPSSLFTCTNLVSLSLCGGIHLLQQKPKSVIRLPLLKTLKLDIDSVECIDILLSACPVLETLHLSFAPNSIAKVSVPNSLKTLWFAVENDVQTFLEIHAPALESLSIVQQKTSCFSCSVGNLHNVEEAYLDVYALDESAQPLLKLLRALSGLKHLELRSLTIKWLLRVPNLKFPEFGFLVHLNLILPSFNLGFVTSLLHKCHVLQILIIQNEKESVSRNWIQPTTDLNCLRSHLTFIQIKGYQGHADELAFAAYVLRSGRVLRTMIIYGDILLNLNHKYRILKLLSAVPRASTECQLNFL